MIAQHSYNTNGTFIVILTVTDDDGAWAQANSTKTVTAGSPLLLSLDSIRIAYNGNEQPADPTFSLRVLILASGLVHPLSADMGKRSVNL